MEGEYKVTFQNRTVGRVSVRKQGLYYFFCCRCIVEGDELYRLRFIYGNEMEDLGILVPMEGSFGTDTRIPVKRWTEAEGVFQLISTRGTNSGNLVRVYPDEPFAYIAGLKKAYLVRRNGEQYIGIR